MAETAERRVEYQVSPGQAGQRLDLFLKDRIPKMSRSHIQEAIRSRVEVAGRTTSPKPSLQLCSGDRVLVRHEVREEPPLPPELEPTVIHLDDTLVAVAKPAGLAVHANRRTIHRHLVGWLREHIGPEVALAHRIDRETSGVVLSTRDTDAARALARDFAAGRVHKEYLAVVLGVPDEEVTVDAPIGHDSKSHIHVKQIADGEGSVPACTRFRRERILAGGTHALVRAFPKTGRRHQIRVHLAAIGHPVVGDKLYAHGDGFFLSYVNRGIDAAMLARLGADRHLLHAAVLEVRHPSRGTTLRLEAPLPADFRAWCDA